MRKGLIIISVIAAAFAGAGFAENGLWLPAIGCVAWVLLVTFANKKKKPRAATRSRDYGTQTKIINFYDSTTTIRTQTKTWTPAGKALTVMHISE